ncbi:hypothetical protein DIPPA_03937 [Diplonema papillatum]|nr:hypothetical protein DIPPA_03937 [Diplonema papillatum]
MSSPLPNADRWDYRFPSVLREAWTRSFAYEPPSKRKFRVREMESFCSTLFGTCEEAVTDRARAVLAEAIGATILEVAGLDLQRVLAILMLVYEEDEARVSLAVKKIVGKFDVPPPSLASLIQAPVEGSGAGQPVSSASVPSAAVPSASPPVTASAGASMQDQLQRMVMQQQEQMQAQQREMRAQQQQQAHMMQVLQQMQTQLMGISHQPSPAVASAAALPTSATPMEADAPMDAPVATVGQPVAVAPRVFVKEAKDVQSLANAIEGDPEGLVRDLEVAYVCGRTHLAGGELLESNFNMLRSWVLSVSATVGWLQSPDQLRLGNDLLTAVRMQRLYVEKGHSRRDLLRQIGTQAEDALDKAEAVLDSKKEKHGPAKKMAFKPRTGNAKAGGK